jgi:hypothetical protein
LRGRHENPKIKLLTRKASTGDDFVDLRACIVLLQQMGQKLALKKGGNPEGLSLDRFDAQGRDVSRVLFFPKATNHA